MATKPPGQPPASEGEDDASDWASALDEWDAQLDNALGGPDVTAVKAREEEEKGFDEEVRTETGVAALPSDQEQIAAPLESAPIKIDDAAPLDEPPPLDGFDLDAVTAQEAALSAREVSDAELGDIFESDTIDKSAATETHAALSTEVAFDADEERTGVFGQKESAAPVDDDDEELEISVSVSSALEEAAEAADMTIASPPAAMPVDEDFYDTIAIVPERDEPSIPKTVPTRPPEEPEPELWSEPSLPVRDENDPDRTPLPIDDKHIAPAIAQLVPALAPRESRELSARRATRPEALASLPRLEDEQRPVQLTSEDRRAFLGLLDTERLLVDGERAAGLAFEAAHLCLASGDLAGAAERAEVALHVDPDHRGALRLERRRAIAQGDLDRASLVIAAARAKGSPREQQALAELAAVVADRRGAHADARKLELEAGLSGESLLGARLADLAYTKDRTPALTACRELVGGTIDAKLGAALDLELAREAEHGNAAEVELKQASAERYLAVLGTDPRSFAAAIGLFRVAVRLGDRALEHQALERMIETLPPSQLRSAVERQEVCVALALGAGDAGRARLSVLADGGDDLAAIYLQDEPRPQSLGEAELAQLTRLIAITKDAGQRASLRYALGAAEEARGHVGAAIAVYSEAAREFAADRRSERALERAKALGGDKQAELERHLRIAGTDEVRAQRSLVRAAALLVELDRPEDALARLDAALDQSATDAEALSLYASIEGAGGRAAARVTTAAEEATDPAFARALRRRAAFLHASAGDAGAALSVVAADLEAHEAADLGRLVGVGEPARLRDFLGDVAERGAPGDAARIHVERATLAPSGEAAGEDLRRAVALDPKLRGALALATRALRFKDPDVCATLLGEHFAAEGARSDLERTHDALEVALALAEDGEDVEGAVKILEAVGAVDRTGLAATELVRLARRKGRGAGLNAVFERALAETTAPEERAAIYYDWACLAKRGGDSDRAADNLRLAFEALPEARVYRDALERAWEKAGDAGRLTDLALADLKEAEETRRKVAAYGRLAFIDEVVRGDAASARMSYESIAELDQNNHDAARRLERVLIIEKRGADLVHLYDRLGISAAEPALAVAISLERARLRKRLAGAEVPAAEVDAAVDNDLRLALFQDPRSRPALREAYARANERRDAAARGELALRLAEIAGSGDAPDSRACAVFLSRAAQSAAALGREGDAITRFQAALERSDAHLPALLGLLDSALREGNLTAAAAAAEQLQRVHREPTLRRDAGLLAAAIVARDLGDRPRAVLLLRAVLESDPRAELAFARLRVLLLEGEEWAALVELLGNRLAIETDARVIIALHVELGELARDRLHDNDRARVELGAALAQDPAHPAALLALADLEERAGRYQEAADLLMRRAKVERSRTALGDLLFRLGVIYTRHIGDAKRAVACLQRVLQVDPKRKPALELLADAYAKEWDWTGAVGAIQTLVQLETDPARRIELLHRAARIQEEGFRDMRQALALYRAALELDPVNMSAVEALAQFFDRQSDTASLRVLIDTTARRLRSGLSGGPRDAAAFHALYRAFTLRRAPDRAAMTAGVLAWMGPVEEGEKQALERLRTREQYPGVALAEPAVDELLFDARVPAGFRNLMRFVEESLLKSFRTDVKHLGVQRADRLPKSGHAVRDVANRIAADLGIRDFDLYVSPALQRTALLELTDPPALCIGAELVEGAHEQQLRFLFARFFKMAQMHLTLALRLEPDALAALTAGVVRQFVPDFSPPGIDPALIATEASRIQKLIPKKLHAELHPFALECAAPSRDLRQLAAGVSAAADRAGLLACGAPGPALAMLERMNRGDAARALALFAVGDELPELRRIIGTNIG